MDWTTLIQTLGGVIGGIGIGSFTKSGRIKDKADAYKAMADGYEARITALHDNIALLNKLEADLTRRISELNDSLNDKTARIRDITDKLYQSEQEVNRVQDMLNAANARIIDLTEERDLYRMWQCRSSICEKGNPDPEGRQPPNPKLRGMAFSPHEKNAQNEYSTEHETLHHSGADAQRHGAAAQHQQRAGIHRQGAHGAACG